jgi:DNA-binding response OmpR family regulator
MLIRRSPARILALWLEDGNDNMQPTILLVEDDLAIRELVIEILFPAGYFVVPISLGDDALDLAHYSQPDLILVDPPFSLIPDPYLTLLAALQVPLMVFAPPQMTHTLLPDLRVVECLPKPFEPEVLLQSVQKHLTV